MDYRRSIFHFSLRLVFRHKECYLNTRLKKKKSLAIKKHDLQVFFSFRPIFQIFSDIKFLETQSKCLQLFLQHLYHYNIIQSPDTITN